MYLLTTVAWYSTWSSIIWGLHSHTNAARKPQRAMQTVLLCKRPPTASNNLHRGRNCCTTHAVKATYIYFLGTRLRLPRRVTLERVPTVGYFLFSACGVDMLPPRPSPLQLDIRWEFKSFPKKPFLIYMCILSEKVNFLTRWGYQKMLSENVILEKAFSDNIRSGFLVP